MNRPKDKPDRDLKASPPTEVEVEAEQAGAPARSGRITSAV